MSGDETQPRSKNDPKPARAHKLRKRSILQVLLLVLVRARRATKPERVKVRDFAEEGAGGGDAEAFPGTPDDADEEEDELVSEERREGDDEEDGDGDDPACGEAGGGGGGGGVSKRQEAGESDDAHFLIFCPMGWNQWMMLFFSIPNATAAAILRMMMIKLTKSASAQYTTF